MPSSIGLLELHLSPAQASRNKAVPRSMLKR
jgi:hypothetical protein